MKNTPQPEEILARQLAGETLADIRTVRRVLRGEQVRGVVGERIRSALATRNSDPQVSHERSAR